MRLRPAAVAVLAICAACGPPSGQQPTAPPVARAAAELVPAPAPPRPLPPRPTGSGAVVVRLRDPAGAPWDTPTQVTLQSGADSDSARIVDSRIAERGEVRFEAVPAGVPVHLMVFPSEPTPQRTPKGWSPKRFATARRSFPGPAAEGEVVTADVTVGRPRPSVTGRLLDADGRPDAGRGLGGVIFAPPGSLVRRGASQTAQTSADGRFTMTFDDEIPESGVLIRLSAPEEGRSGGRDVDIVTVPWTADATPLLDVGDVRTHAPEVAVAGRFVAEDGAGVPLGECTASVARPFGTYWSGVNGLSARASSDGRFEIRGDVPSNAGYSLVGGVPEGFAVERAVPIDAPVRDAVLRVVRCASVTGSVALPRGVAAWDSVTATIEGAGAESGTAGVAAIARWSDVTFTFARVLPGKSRVTVHVRGAEQAIVSADLDLAPGESSRPAALQGVDLRPLARRRSVRVRDENGAAFSTANVWMRAPEADASWMQGEWGADGTVTRTFLTGGYDVVALAPGMLPDERRGATGDVELVLRKAAPSVITVRLAPDVPLPAPPVVLAVGLAWRGTADRPVATEIEGRLDPRGHAFVTAKPFDESRTATFEVEAPGRWAAELRVTRVAPGSGFGGPIRPCRSTETLVTETPQALEIVVGADADTCEATYRVMSR